MPPALKPISHPTTPVTTPPTSRSGPIHFGHPANVGEWQTLNLWVHPPSFSEHEALIRPDALPNLQNGHILQIYQPSRDESRAGSHHYQAPTPSSPSSKSDLAPPGRKRPSQGQRRVLVMYHEPDKDLISRPSFQISLCQEIQQAFGFQSRADVLVKRVDPKSVAADFVTLTFRDQYLGRSDMWRLNRSIQGTCVYTKKRITFAGCIHTTVKEIYCQGQPTPCGYITPDTKILFRSESARFHLFLQMSREMWDFDEDGEVYFEKATSGFLPELFRRWEDASTHHVVSIILFTRVLYPTEGPDRLYCSWSGKWYRDFYKVLADCESHGRGWRESLGQLRREFVTFQQTILEQQDGGGEYVSITGSNTSAEEGNILEAVNLALTTFDRHYIDRDLVRTGLSIVVVTPGTGIFHVDKSLLRLTTERMFDTG
ncbi:hypothetical protein BJ684DRAFT_19966, partial [Piptocephalis cylindrospora]